MSYATNPAGGKAEYVTSIPDMGMKRVRVSATTAYGKKKWQQVQCAHHVLPTEESVLINCDFIRLYEPVQC